MSVSELKTIAKSLGIKGSYSMKKSALITAIEGLKNGSLAAPVKARPAVLPDIEMEKKDEPLNVKSARKPNSWNDHIRAYRAEHSCSLREAMSKARETYGKSEKANYPDV